MKTTLPCPTLGGPNFDGITELTGGEILDRINKIGADGRQRYFDRRNMKADEGDLFRQVPGVLRRLLLKELSFQPRSGCKSLSHPPTRGRVYLRKSLRVVGDGEKVDFLRARRAEGAMSPAKTNELVSSWTRFRISACLFPPDPPSCPSCQNFPAFPNPVNSVIPSKIQPPPTPTLILSKFLSLG